MKKVSQEINRRNAGCAEARMVEYHLEPQGWALPQAFEHGDHVLDELEGRWLHLRSRCVEIRPRVWAAMVSLETDENLVEAHFDGEFLWRVATPCDPELSRWQA